jgi:hypothetical protein
MIDGEEIFGGDTAECTEGIILSGKKTSSGRTSGETIFGAEGARLKRPISQAKGQS